MTSKSYSDYKTPNEILVAPELNTETKLELLNRWKADEEALQRAASEGLNNGVSPNLQTVQKALTTLVSSDKPANLETTLENADLSSAAKQVQGIFGTKSS